MFMLRLSGRQKQGECTAILTLSFFIIVLCIISLGFIPGVYITAIRPLIISVMDDRIISATVSIVTLTVSAVLYHGLNLGVDRFMLKRAESITTGAGDIFYYLSPKRVLPMSLFMFRFSLYKTITLAFFSVPAIVCCYIFHRISSAGFSAIVCSVFGASVIVFLLSALKSYKEVCDSLFLVRYRYIKGTALSFGNLLSQSQQDMKTKCHILSKLKLSFLGWFALCIFVIPIPYVWSYYRQTKACFAAEECKL